MSTKSLVPIQLPADPTAALEAATKQYADGKIAATGGTMTGGLYIQPPAQGNVALRVVQGQVTAGNTADFDLTGAASVSVPTPLSNAHAATKLYVDTQRDTRVAKVGDTMTGVLNIHHDLARMELKSAAGVGRAIFGSDATGLYLTAVVGGIDMVVDSESKLNVADAVITTTVPILLPGAPTAALHAATKQYVDDNAGGGGSATWTGTQAAMDALGSLDPATFYYVTPS